MPITLPQLPFEPDALAPHISAETVNTHYGKHHSGYVKKTNAAIEKIGTLENAKLDEVIRFANADAAHKGLLNNAAQVWNHNAYWKSLSPTGGGQPKGPLMQALQAVFGGYDDFAEQFKKTATSHFGSGWAWLTTDGSTLTVCDTHDAGCPLLNDEIVLVCCDVWEHAYYLDSKNDRAQYVETFLKHLINWSYAERQWEQLQTPSQ